MKFKYDSNLESWDNLPRRAVAFTMESSEVENIKQVAVANDDSFINALCETALTRHYAFQVTSDDVDGFSQRKMVFEGEHAYEYTIILSAEWNDKYQQEMKRRKAEREDKAKASSTVPAKSEVDTCKLSNRELIALAMEATEAWRRNMILDELMMRLEEADFAKEEQKRLEDEICGALDDAVDEVKRIAAAGGHQIVSIGVSVYMDDDGCIVYNK